MLTCHLECRHNSRNFKKNIFEEKCLLPKYYCTSKYFQSTRMNMDTNCKTERLVQKSMPIHMKCLINLGSAMGKQAKLVNLCNF